MAVKPKNNSSPGSEAEQQLDELLRHSYYLNVEARTLVACLMALWARRTT